MIIINKLTKIYVHTEDNEENLIFNGLTGSLDIANKNIAKFLLSNNNTDIKILNHDDKKMLKDGYYLVEDESALEQKIYDKYIEVASDYINRNSFIICTTLNCNLHCHYCFENGVCDRTDAMNDDKLKKALEFINERCIENKNKSFIDLFGGEPLLDNIISIDEKILDFAKKNNIKVNITTNGTTIKNIKNILSKYVDIIDNIQITLDGHRDMHDKIRFFSDGKGTFDIIMQNTKILLDLGIETTLRINIDKNNLSSLDKLIYFIDDSDLVYYEKFSYYIAPVTNKYNLEDDNLLDEADLAIELEKRNILDKGIFTVLGYFIESIVSSETNRLASFNRCYAYNKNSYVLSPDGFIYNCPEQMGDNKNAKIQYFPIYDEKSINQNQTFSNVLKQDKQPKCRTCTFALLCGGGCLVPKKSNKYCLIQKKTINKYFYHLRCKLNLK